MSKATGAPHAAPTVYAIPEQAHFALVQINYFLRLMAYLTETGTKASSHDARLRPDSLGWCFSGLAKEIDAVVAAIYFSSDIAAKAEKEQAPDAARVAKTTRHSKARHN